MNLKKLEMLRSQGVTIHSCTECSYQTEIGDNLTVYLRTHSGVKSWQIEERSPLYELRQSTKKGHWL